MTSSTMNVSPCMSYLVLDIGDIGYIDEIDKIDKTDKIDIIFVYSPLVFSLPQDYS